MILQHRKSQYTRLTLDDIGRMLPRVRFVETTLKNGDRHKRENPRRMLTKGIHLSNEIQVED